MYDYEGIKRLVKETGAKTRDLLVLADHHDPFYAGSPTRIKQAEWFADLWERFGFDTGVHLRRIHYRLISEDGFTDHNGEPYLNTEKCWGDLGAASRHARHLKLVDPAAFVDRRNPEPHVYINARESDPGWDYYFEDWRLPKIPEKLRTRLDIPELYVYGYNYENSLQPYHVEVWCEKSTMNSELMPICQRHAANFVTGVGYMSITSVIQLLNRVKALDKPCRILYVSDFDPAGGSMPVSVARQIEFAVNSYAAGADIRLNRLILSADQVEEYRLPRTPIKDTDLRKDNFEAIYGTGAVELDALEALHPGELARLVEEAIEEFRDPALRVEAWRTKHEAQQALEDHAADELPYSELDALRNEVQAIAADYEDRLAALNAELQSELDPYRERVDSLRHAVEDSLENLDPPLPGLPESEDGVAAEGWLYDSRREYLDQIDFYKRHQRGE